LRIPRVIVPTRPGALSAFGILVSEVVKDYSRTVLWRTINDLPVKRLREEFSNLRSRADNDFRSEDWRGPIRHRFSVDIRYRGQGYELNLPDTEALVAAFRREHERRYGYSYPAREVELVTLRLRATVKSPQASIGIADIVRANQASIAAERAPVFFDGRKITATIYDRDSLEPGKKYSGPAVVTEYSATTVVPPRNQFWVDQAGNLFIQIRP
jgi:N-methylhydantoinase A